MTSRRRTSGRGTLDVSRPAPLKRARASDRGPRSSSSPAGTLRPAPELYAHEGHPGQLIARERRWLVAWPSEPGGWPDRVVIAPADAPPPGLVPVPLTAAWGTGWRHAQRPDHVPAKGPVPTVGGAEGRRPLTVHVPVGELAEIDRRRGDQTRSAWVREAIRGALQATPEA